MSLHEERQQAAGYVSRVIKQRDEAFKLLERLEALRSDLWPTDLADVLTQAADMLKVVGEITADFRTLIAKGK